MSKGSEKNVEYSVVISGGRVVDGTGNPWFYADLGIRNDRIAAIAAPGALKLARARERIDAHGLIVAPGFIDIQSHSGPSFLGAGDGRVINKITQGITTEILGEDWTEAPANAAAVETARAVGRPITSNFFGRHGFRSWLEAMQSHGMSVNVGSFVGFANLRSCVKGLSTGPLTSTELEAVRSLLREAMEDGAFGVAPALSFPPSSFASSSELVEIVRAAAPYGGIFAVHLRSEDDDLLASIDEVLKIGREARIPVEIYHFKAVGRRNWAKEAAAIKKIDDARREGVDVGAMMYPYEARNGKLADCLPPKMASANLVSPLHTADAPGMVRLESPSAVAHNPCVLVTPEGVMLRNLRSPGNARFAGKTLSEFAAAKGKDWSDAAADLIDSEPEAVNVFFFVASEPLLVLQMQQPWIEFGTDFGSEDPENPREPYHPRAFGTYPRVLGKYLRDENAISLEDAVRKMTGAVARTLSIQDRGSLRKGNYADIVIFDPRCVEDRATYGMPNQLSVGIRYVYVNGAKVVSGGKPTGVMAGRALYGPGVLTE